MGRTKRPWEPAARRAAPGGVGNIYYTGRARTDEAASWWEWESSPARERDFVSQFGGEEGGQGTQCRVRRHSLSLSLSLSLGREEEEQQQTHREVEVEVDDAAILRGNRAPASTVSLLPPRQAAVVGEPGGGYSTPSRIRRASSCAPQQRPPTPRPPSSGLNGAMNPQVLSVSDIATQLGQPAGGQCRPSLSLLLSLPSGSEEKEEEELNQQVDAAAGILRGHQASTQPQPPSLPPLPPLQLQAPRQASVVAELGGHWTPHRLRRATSCAPPRSSSIAPPQTPRAPPPPSASAPKGSVGLPQIVSELGARLAQPESWWFALAKRNDRLGRKAWLSHHGLMARQAVQRFSAAACVCVDAGFTCPACRFRPAKVVTAPRTHLCLCWDCGYVFRDDPVIACPVCAAVRAWGIRA